MDTEVIVAVVAPLVAVVGAVGALGLMGRSSGTKWNLPPEDLDR